MLFLLTCSITDFTCSILLQHIVFLLVSVTLKKVCNKNLHIQPLPQEEKACIYPY